MKAKKETALVRSVAIDFIREGHADGIHMTITPLVHGGSGVLYAVSFIVPQSGRLWHTWLTNGWENGHPLMGIMSLSGNGGDDIPFCVALFATIAEAAAAGMSKAVLEKVSAAVPF